MSISLEPGMLTLAEAAARMGCHVETLRIRFRRSKGLDFARGPHGRIYVTEEELSYLVPIRRMKRRPPGPEWSAVVNAYLERLASGAVGLIAWEQELVAAVLADPAADRPLFNALGVQALRRAGLNLPETAEQLGISERQVRRLRRLTYQDAVLAAWQRRRRAERGAVRRRARPIVRAIQARLAAAGFRPARRDPRSGESGARGGVPARVALVRDLSRDQARALLRAGLGHSEVAAISLIGIGSDELNHLILHGLPADPSTGPT